MDNPLLCSPAPDNPLHCPACGAVLPAGALVATCKGCLKRRYAGVLLAREAEHLTDQAEPSLVVAQQGLRYHLVLAVDHTRTYCGRRVLTQPFKKIKHRISVLPDVVCKACVQKLDEVKALSAKGVTI